MVSETAALIPMLPAVMAIVCLAVYVLADGFDLGVGFLLLLAPRQQDRDVMMASVAPGLDGNEAWLVMGGLLLLAVLPSGGSSPSPALYVPVAVMLAALVFRGIVLALRPRLVRLRWVCDCAFAGGSLLATLCQGVILGVVVGGVAVRSGQGGGGVLDDLALPALCGAGLIGGYALLGAGWLIWRADGPAQVFGREVAHAAIVLTGATVVALALWGAFGLPSIVRLAPLAALAVLLLLFAWWRIWTGRRGEIFLLAMLIVLLGFTALVVDLWPSAVSPNATIRNAVAALQAHLVMAGGAAIVVAAALVCQARAGMVLLGKVGRPAAGYGGADP